MHIFQACLNKSIASFSILIGEKLIPRKKLHKYPHSGNHLSKMNMATFSDSHQAQVQFKNGESWFPGLGVIWRVMYPKMFWCWNCLHSVETVSVRGVPREKEDSSWKTTRNLAGLFCIILFWRKREGNVKVALMKHWF